MSRVIHLVDGRGNSLFDLSDGSYLRVDSPDGDNRIMQCEYIDDTRMRIDGVEQVIPQFVDMMKAEGMWLRPVGVRG